jgi:hypothetical protein
MRQKKKFEGLTDKQLIEKYESGRVTPFTTQTSIPGNENADILYITISLCQRRNLY